MPRRPANITQADIARTIRAAKKSGADSVEVRLADGATIVVRLRGVPPAPSELDQSNEWTDAKPM